MDQQRAERVFVDAFVYLEITPEAVAAQPRVSHLFKHVPGGETAVWEMLEASSSPEARKLCEFRGRLTQGQRDVVPFEAIAIAAGFATKKAFGIASEAVVEYSQDASKLILHAATPDMMTKAVENAKTLEGAGERKTLLQAVGLVPRPKNSTTIINGDVVKGNKNQVAVLPDPGDTGRRLGSRFMMEMAVPAALPAPAEVDEDPEDESDVTD
jgi:hypothetical protein